MLKLKYKPKCYHQASFVRTLLDLGVKDNFISLNLSTKWNLPLISGTNILLACGKQPFSSSKSSHPLIFFLKKLKFKVQANVLPDLAYDVVLGQAWWRDYSPSFDLSSNFVVGVNRAGLLWLAHLEGSLLLSPLLGKIVMGDFLTLPKEPSRFAPLFAPNDRVLSVKGK